MTMVKPPTVDEYRAAKIQNALDYSPSQYACKKCGWPVVRGYVCTACGDTNPSEASK